MGSTRPPGRGSEIAEIPPDACPNGHRLQPPNVAVAHLPCRCGGAGGHRMHTCLTCGRITYEPAHITGAASTGQ
jgi:hypothetical protein